MRTMSVTTVACVEYQFGLHLARADVKLLVLVLSENASIYFFISPTIISLNEVK